MLPTSNPQIVSTSNSSSNNSSAKSTSQIASKEPVFHTDVRTANTRLGKIYVPHSAWKKNWKMNKFESFWILKYSYCNFSVTPRQRQEIYALNRVMTRLENEKFKKFCHEKGFKGDSAEKERLDYDIFMWRRKKNVLWWFWVWVLY